MTFSTPNDAKQPEHSRRRAAFAATMRRFRKLCVAVGVAVLAAELVYVLAINLFLSTSLFERVVNADPGAIDVHFRRGWSLFPGRIHAQHLSIRGRDGSVEWIVRLDRVDFHVSFLAFARKRFHVLSAKGSGITFRLRERVVSPKATPEYVAKLPPIDGFPTLRFTPDERVGKDVWSDRDYHLFTIHLEDLVADDVREVWIDTARFEGRARITGGFYLKPIRVVSVGPAHVEVTPGGHVAVAGVPAAEAVSGSFDFALRALDPRVASGADVVHGTTLSTDLQGDLPDVGAIPIVPDDARVHGRLEARRVALRVVDGQLRDDTRIDLRAAALAATLAGHEFGASIAVTGGVAQGRASLCVNGGDLRATDLFGEASVVACGDSRALDLAHPFTDLHAQLDVPTAVLPDASVLDRSIPRGTPVRIVSGRAEGAVHAEAWFDQKRATGNASLHADELDVEVAKVRARGVTTVNASVAAWSWATRKASGVHVVVGVADAAIAMTTAPTTTLVKVRGLSLDATGDDVDVDDPLRSLHAKLALPAGDVVDEVLLHAYLPKGNDMRIEHGHSRFEATCDVAIEDHRAAGTLDVRADRVGLKLRDLHLVADVRAHGRVHDWEWVHGNLAVDAARVDVDSIRVSRAAEPSAVTIRHVSAMASSPGFSFSDPLARVRLALAIKGGNVRDPAAIDEFLPAGSALGIIGNDGSFGIDFAADIAQHVARGQVAVRSHGMGVAGKKVQLSGDMKIAGRVDRWDFNTTTIGVRDLDATVENVTGGFDGTTRTVDFTADRIALAVKNASFDLARPSLEGADYHLSVGRADLPEARVLNTFVPDKALFAVESGSARVSADVTLSPTRRAGEGWLEVTLSDAAVRFQKTHYGGQFVARARVVGFDPDHDALDLSGSRLVMRGVRVIGAPTSTSAWQGDVVLREGTLRFDPAPAINGTLTIDARDARPAIALLLGDSLPKFLVGLTDMPRLMGSAQLDVAPGLFVLSAFDARGGDIAVRGTYVVRDDHRHGAFVIEKGILSAGLRVADDGAHLRLFGLDGWLREETRAALEAASCAVPAMPRVGAQSYCLALPGPAAGPR